MIGDPLTAIVLGLLAAMVLAVVAYRVVRAAKARVDLDLPQTVHVLGDAVAGHVVIRPRRRLIVNHVLVTLRCYERFDSDSVAGSGREDVILYEYRQEAARDLDLPAGHETRLNFDLKTPHNLPSADSVTIDSGSEILDSVASLAFRMTRGRICWVVEADVDCEGIDLGERREVYVNQTSGSPGFPFQSDALGQEND